MLHKNIGLVACILLTTSTVFGCNLRRSAPSVTCITIPEEIIMAQGSETTPPAQQHIDDPVKHRCASACATCKSCTHCVVSWAPGVTCVICGLSLSAALLRCAITGIIVA